VEEKREIPFQVEGSEPPGSRVVPGPGVVLDGAWSPDGSKLLVTREEGGNSNIYLLDRDGQLLQRSPITGPSTWRRRGPRREALRLLLGGEPARRRYT